MDSPKIELRDTKKYGKGVYAKKKIKKGEFVTEFDGTVYPWHYKGWNNDLYHHTIQFEKKKWRDSKGIARWLNHSCEPNCGIKGKFRLVAMRDIAPGEELLWDYEMTEDHPYWRLRCRCGTKSCRKNIGAYRNMPEETRKKYKGYISWWLTRKK